MLYENHLERSFTMKKTLTILPLCMAVSLSASILPSVTALASPFPAQICDEPDNDPGIMPYYLYIQSMDLMVEPGPSEVTYNIDIDGIDILGSVTGTATLYKRNNSGVYEKNTSRSHSFSGPRVIKGFSFSSYGPGEYKLNFKGTAYSTTGGSEKFDITAYGSY